MKKFYINLRLVKDSFPVFKNRISFQETNKLYGTMFYNKACKMFESFSYALVEEHSNYKKYSKDGITFYVPRVQDFFFWVFTEEKDFIFYDKLHYFALRRLYFLLARLCLFKHKLRYFKETGRCN